MTDADESRSLVVAEVDEWSDRLVAVSHDIHANPELNFAEHHAHAALVELLSSAGLDVEPHAYGLDTAFAARAGHGSGPLVAVLCEYDALPGLGHACGHNVIAAAGAGAGIAAARVVDELGGRLVVLGCPAEEGGGGKIDLIEAGAFAHVDAAMMVHPADADLTRMEIIAVAQYRVRYTGLASHAAAAPQRGKNALDAAVLGYVNVAALRQHILPSERVHGIFTEAGEAPNVVPRTAEAIWFVRSPTLAGLERLTERVHRCLRAGADAAGCEISIREENRTFADMVDNQVLLERFAANAASLGRTMSEPRSDRTVVGSTDMGNVSHVVPSIHPIVKVAPGGVAIHTADFVRYAAGDQADQTVVDAAKAMALTVSDLWRQPDLVEAARTEFAAAHAEIPEAERTPA